MATTERPEFKIGSLCKDHEYAISLFLKTFMYYEKGYIISNAELYGLNKSKLEEVINTIRSLEGSSSPYTITADELEEIALSCIEKYSSDLEKITRDRIKILQGSEIETLKYLSYILKTLKRPISRYERVKALYVSTSETADSLSLVLSITDSEAQLISKDLLVKTGIAFYNGYNYIIPPYAIKIIDELTKEVEEKFNKAIEAILGINDAVTLSVLLIKLREGNESVFNAVYGSISLSNYLKTCRIPMICYEGHINYSLVDSISNIIAEKIKGRFEKLYDALKNALSQKGFEIVTVYEPTAKELYYTIFAVKPEQYEVAIHVIPFPYKLPEKRADKEVLVFEGPIAKPSYFEKYVVVGMDKDFNKVKKVVDNVNTDWSKELSEVFKSLNITVTPQHPITPSVPVSSTPIVSPLMPSSSFTLAPLSDKDIPEKIENFKKKGVRDILEAVVAAVLQDLGFKVEVDYQVRSKDGATREVDVWAWKNVSGVDFSVYVSCKNLDREIGTPIIDQEAGRVDQLHKAPNMKFIVASKFIDQAKRAAIADGFIPIEIGFKVDESNAIEAYKRVYEVMNGVFTAIAPKRLQQLAESISKVSEELRRISDELSRLASGSQ